MSLEERALEVAMSTDIEFVRIDVQYTGRCRVWYRTPTPVTPQTIARRIDKSGLAQSVGYGWSVQEGLCHVSYLLGRC